MKKIDFTKVVDVKQYYNNLVDDQNDFLSMLNDAQSELLFYDWCLEVLESYIGIYFAGIVGVFLFKIKPINENIDEWIWVIVGDLPSIYITCDVSPNPACALDAYVGAMQEWVEAAEKGDSVDDLVPVNVSATPENAARLKSRLSMLDERVLGEYKEDLKTR